MQATNSSLGVIGGLTSGSVSLMSTTEQNFLRRNRRPRLFVSPEKMTGLPAPPPKKKRKLNKTENLVYTKKEFKSSFYKLGNDRKKVHEAARGGLQDVNVAFYRAREVTLLDKKDRKIEKVWSDHKQGTRGMLQTCRSYIKKKVKGDMAKASYASHHDHLKHRPKHSNYRCSSLLKTKNLRDLLPNSKFHSVKRRTPFSYEHMRTAASLYSPNGNDSESKVGAASNRRTYMALPISLGAAQRGTFPLISQILDRAATKSELSPVCGAERKDSDKGTHKLVFKGSILDGGGLEGSRKITKAYVRNKYREPFFKDERPDLYALHLLADTALNLGLEPIFHVQVQRQQEESRQGRNEHEPSSTNGNSHISKVNAERNGGEGSTSEAVSVIQKDLQSDEVSLNVHIFPDVNNLICTSIDEKQNLNQELKKKNKELISKDNISIKSNMAGFHVTKESQEDATNADQKADGAENECIDCHSTMCTQPHTLEGFQIKQSNFDDVTKLSCAPCRKDTFLPGHEERVDETIVEKVDMDLKGGSECLREQYSVFISVESLSQDKVSSAWCQLEPCSTYRENSQPRLLTCMETPQKSEGHPSDSSTKSFFDRSPEVSPNSKGCPSSFNNTKFRNRSPNYCVREIVQSSKLKATRMVDVAVKVMSSMKVGDNAYAMIGEALDSAGIGQVGLHSCVSRLQHCSYLQNGGLGDCHQDLSCNPAEVASIIHSINSTGPTFFLNDYQISPKLISACVSALLMIQACSDTILPPAEAMEILEHAARDLRPQNSQNLHIYWEIEELMNVIKTQVLSLVRTPGSNLQI